MKQPHILCSEGDLAERAIVVGDPARVERIAQQLENPQEVAYNREFKSMKGSFQGKEIAVMSTGIGGPSTAIAIEEMIKTGVKNIIRVGSCGSMQDSVEIGDVVIPDGIVRAEGTTTGYVPKPYPASATPDLFIALRDAAENSGAKFHTGTTLTIDSLYAESTEDRKSDWADDGVLVQEMEGATVLTVSKLRGAKAGAVFLVVNAVNETDIEQGIGKYTNQSVGKTGDLIEKEAQAIMIALEAITKI
ncbi:nucleoside phosphorylase [Patescibacteria group bacterium]